MARSKQQPRPGPERDGDEGALASTSSAKPTQDDLAPLKTLIDRIPEPTLVREHSGRLRFANPPAGELLGLADPVPCDTTLTLIQRGEAPAPSIYLVASRMEVVRSVRGVTTRLADNIDLITLSSEPRGHLDPRLVTLVRATCDLASRAAEGATAAEARSLRARIDQLVAACTPSNGPFELDAPTDAGLYPSRDLIADLMRRIRRHLTGGARIKLSHDCRVDDPPMEVSAVSVATLVLSSLDILSAATDAKGYRLTVQRAGRRLRLTLQPTEQAAGVKPELLDHKHAVASLRPILRQLRASLELRNHSNRPSRLIVSIPMPSQST